MIAIGKKRIGEGCPCFITFEAGPTHAGLESAKRLVTLAAEAGADAVKFQMTDPDRLVADRSISFTYEVLKDRKTGTRETLTEPLYDILKRRSLTFREWEKVKSHADQLGLALFFTVGFDDLVDRVVDMDCESIKIASADVNHFPLIRKAAQSGLCLQLDTGNATIGEIEAAVDIIRAEGSERIIIHNCPSGYPARLESINLRLIPTLSRMFPYPVGFSDHSPGWIMDVAALGLGVHLVEKTITEDRTTRSVEHLFSLEPSDMKAFVRDIREVETAMGQPRRVFSDEERRLRKMVRRSVYLRHAVCCGDKLGEVDVFFQRPGYGIPPDLYEELMRMRFKTDLPAGHMLRLSDLE